jgi:hypothetical protein
MRGVAKAMYANVVFFLVANMQSIDSAVLLNLFSCNMRPTAHGMLTLGNHESVVGLIINVSKNTCMRFC